MKQQLPIVFLTGRPAAGKSEIIDYLKKCSPNERLRRFHIGNFIEIDDFPMLWTWFEEDALLERMGKPRLHSDSEGFFKYPHLWNLLIQRIDLDYNKLLTDKPGFKEEGTAILEFARGSEHGGWKTAFAHFSDEVLGAGAVLYIDVSFDESLRKNRRRFNPDKPHSILEHGLPDEKMEKLYGLSDWDEFSSADENYLEINGIKVPYAVFDNSDDLTTRGGDALGARLEEVLSRLWNSRQACE
ncbi:MAG: hypothetical protein JEZ04_01840 [Spirochaetales bacterium]|nr:hypothetical protein [Spirochaetales bacterium]